MLSEQGTCEFDQIAYYFQPYLKSGCSVSPFDVSGPCFQPKVDDISGETKVMMSRGDINWIINTTSRCHCSSQHIKYNLHAAISTSSHRQLSTINLQGHLPPIASTTHTSSPNNHRRQIILQHNASL